MLATASKPRDHGVHRCGVTDIDAVAGYLAAMEVHQFGRGLVANAFAATANVDLGAELEEARSHRLAEAGAAAGHKDAPAGKKLLIEHGFHPGGMC